MRRLGGGSTAAVLLARGGGRSVALRCYREGVPATRIDAEVESLGRTRSRHLSTLLDLATGPDGRPVPVLDAVIGPSLEELLRARHGSIHPGEVVTVLAPLAELQHELHEVGVVVGRWSPAGVRIGADGAPVLTALSGLAAAPPLPARFRRHEPGVRADLAGLRTLGEEVISAVRPDRREALLAALAYVDDARDLEQALFDAARPAPLVVALSAESPIRRADGARLDGRPLSDSADAASSEWLAPPAPGLRGTLIRVLDDLGLPQNLIAVLRPIAARLERPPTGPRTGWRLGATRRTDRAAVPDRGRRSARRRSSSPPRRSVVLVGAAGLLALLASIAVIVLEDDGAGSAASLSEPRPVAEPSGQDGAVPRSRDNGDDLLPDAAGYEGERSPLADDTGPSAADSSAVDSDAEPDADAWGPLVSELVERWAACRALAGSGDVPESCAESVVQPGSAAAELLVAPDVTPADELLAPPPADVVVVDRLGSAVLIDLIHSDGTRTASLLVMRSEAGWRVRSVLD